MDKMIFLGAMYGTFSKDGEDIKFAKVYLGERRDSGKQITVVGFVAQAFKMVDPAILTGIKPYDEVEVFFDRLGRVISLRKC